MNGFSRLASIVACVCFVWPAPCVRAQQFELTPFAGYTVGGTFDSSEGDAEIQPDLDYGLTLSWRVRHDGLVELIYSRQETTLEIDRFRGVETLDFDVETFHFGGLWEIGHRERSHPFLGLSVGGTHFSPPALSDEWAFSAGISGGLKHWFSEHVGLRLEGRGLATLGLQSGGIFCGAGPGGGGCAVVASGDALFQIQANVGLIFGF
jgi:hypothetical protein